MAKKNWKIQEVEDFVIFMASDDIIDETNIKMAASNGANVEFLAANPPAQVSMPITGTFICAQPPNYRGLPMLHATEADWTAKFQLLKSLGVDTVIYQAAVWNELETVYYPSKRFAKYRLFDSLEKVLSAAETVGLTVYLGGYGSVAGWCMGKDPAFVQNEKDNHFAVQDELYSLYGGRFKGIYFAPETAYRGERDLYAEKALNSIYRDFCDRLKSLHPECEIIMSPATKYYEGKLGEMTDSWHAILDGVQLDIMAPQDSIGCCGNILKYQPVTFKVWKDICDAHNVRLWSNVELFENIKLPGIDHAQPADTRRVAYQMAHASAVVEKMISWEMLYYTDDSAGPRAKLLRDFLRQTSEDYKSRPL